MPTAIIFDLHTALVDVFTPIVPPGVDVFDGIGADSSELSDCVMVGIGNPNGDSTTSATGTIEWAGLGHKASKEHGSVACCAIAVTGEVGSDAQQQVRETVRDIVTAIEASLRDDPNLGGRVPGLNWVRYGGSWDFDQIPADDGTGAVFHFEVAYQASLTV